MKITDFIERAQRYDSTNVFGVGHQDIDGLPEVLRSLYECADPIDVEVPSRKYGNIHFCSFAELQTEYKRYGFFNPGTIVFATSNGDPFFVLDNKIYTTYESDYAPEYVASTLESFLSLCKI